MHTTKMPNKLIKKGYKIWALCDRGYLFNFLFYSYISKTVKLLNSVNPFDSKEKTKSKEKEDLTNIQNVVFTLAQALPHLSNGQTFTIYMDNLFSSTRLFRQLRLLGIGACGTTRANMSADFPDTLMTLKEK